MKKRTELPKKGAAWSQETGVGSRVCRFTFELDDEVDDRLRAIDRDLGLIAGVPSQAGVEVLFISSRP